MSTSARCPCDRETPRVVENLPGLEQFDYRCVDFDSVRRALLQPRSGEQALADWRPGERGDLGVQLLEWWAYLAEILAFYNERALHEVFLRTAVFPEDVRRIVGLLGYRPRPGIAATGVVAALLDTSRPFVLPRGFALQGSAGAGSAPQIFELDRDTELGLLGQRLPESARVSSIREEGWSGYASRDVQGKLQNEFPAKRATDTSLVVRPGQRVDICVRGAVTNAREGDVVLLVPRRWNGTGHALAAVHSLDGRRDESGRPVTIVTLDPGQSLAADRRDYRLVKATKLSHLWLYHDRYPGPKSPSVGGTIAQIAEQIFDPAGLFSGGISHEPAQDPHVLTSHANPPDERGPGAAHLEAIARGISPGDPVLFEKRDRTTLAELCSRLASSTASGLPALDDIAFLVKVTGYSELIWYANMPEGDRIGQGPPIGPPSHGLISGGASPIPIPHTKIDFIDDEGRASRLAGVDDAEIRTIVVHYGWQDVGELVEVPHSDPTTTPEVPPSAAIPPGARLPVLIEDATGAGVVGFVGSTNEPGPALVSPLRALINLLPISRGQTVTSETLGSGSSLLIHQELALRQSPLTYLTDATTPNGYRSTLRVHVDGIEWHEVPTFYGQPPDARVFVTREDEQQRTYVRFGDGEAGARVPTGVDNVVASYRHGSGKEVPPIGALTTIVRPQIGLQAIRNPIAPGGGADPEHLDHLRSHAPSSVLTFGRAIAGDDYAVIAAQTPGVRRAKARWGWDARTQRSLVKVFVGDDVSAVRAADAALRAVCDPERPVVVSLASPRYVDLSLTLEVAPDHSAEAVSAQVAAALLDPRAAPFGSDVAEIDAIVYDSEIYAACLRIPGVLGVHGLVFSVGAPAGRIAEDASPPGFGSEHAMWTGSDPAPPGRGSWTRDPLERHACGEGRFYLLQGDRLHIMTEVARRGR